MILPFNRQNTWKYLIQYSECKDLISGSLHVTPQILIVEIQCALNMSKVAGSLYRRSENFRLLNFRRVIFSSLGTPTQIKRAEN